MTTKTALITGTSRQTGIGFAVAHQLAEQGFHVILTARDVSRAEPPAAEHLTRTFGQLDVLINNASDVVDFTALSALDADIDAVRCARIVNVSSVSALQIATGLDLGASLRAPAHSFAKHTLDVLTGVLANALKDTRILVNSVDPGETATHPERGDEDDARQPVAPHGPNDF